MLVQRQFSLFFCQFKFNSSFVNDSYNLLLFELLHSIPKQKWVGAEAIIENYLSFRSKRRIICVKLMIQMLQIAVGFLDLNIIIIKTSSTSMLCFTLNPF